MSNKCMKNTQKSNSILFFPNWEEMQIEYRLTGYGEKKEKNSIFHLWLILLSPYHICTFSRICFSFPPIFETQHHFSPFSLCQSYKSHPSFIVHAFPPSNSDIIFLLLWTAPFCLPSIVSHLPKPHIAFSLQPTSSTILSPSKVHPLPSYLYSPNLEALWEEPYFKFLFSHLQDLSPLLLRLGAFGGGGEFDYLSPPPPFLFPSMPPI